MALDHPVLNLQTGGWLRSSRLFELGVVVGLTVSVVVVAALYRSTSDSNVPVTAGSVDRVSQTTANHTADAKMSSSAIESAEVASADGVSSSIPANPNVAMPEQAPNSPVAPAGSLGGVLDLGVRSLPSSFERYQVQRGETLESIADAVGLTLLDLLLWNRHLDEDSVLIPGEWLSIPQWDVSAVADEPRPAADDGKSGRGGG